MKSNDRCNDLLKRGLTECQDIDTFQRITTTQKKRSSNVVSTFGLRSRKARQARCRTAEPLKYHSIGVFTASEHLTLVTNAHIQARLVRYKGSLT